MKSFRPGRPSPALVIALIALFVALGGTGYAALKLPKNSVGTKQLKNNAVTGVKVKNGSLTSSDFKLGQIPAGPQGPQGPQGAQGVQGVPGPVNVTFVQGDATTVFSGGDQEFAEADCPSGTVPSGGGVFSSGGSDMNVNSSFPTGANGTSPAQPNAWGAFVNNNGASDETAFAYAICVQTTHASANFAPKVAR
jgi:hypothetical protein